MEGMKEVSIILGVMVFQIAFLGWELYKLSNKVSNLEFFAKEVEGYTKDLNSYLAEMEGVLRDICSEIVEEGEDYEGECKGEDKYEEDEK